MYQLQGKLFQKEYFKTIEIALLVDNGSGAVTLHKKVHGSRSRKLGKNFKQDVKFVIGGGAVPHMAANMPANPAKVETKAYWEDEKTKNVICFRSKGTDNSEKIIKLYIEDGKLVERIACIDSETGKMMEGFLKDVFERD